MTVGIARDLSAKLQADLASVLERNMMVANHVLDTPTLSLVMMEGAVMAMRTTAATIASLAHSDVDTAELFDGAIDAMFEMARQGREKGLAKIAAARRESGR